MYRSALTSWRIRPIGNKGAKSSGPTGCPVPGCITGGGGAGGYRASGYGPAPLQGCTLNLKWGSYAVTVGAGGAGSKATGTNGGNSVFDTITSSGGGKGGNTNQPGGPGGSGGGAGSASASTPQCSTKGSVNTGGGGGGGGYDFGSPPPTAGGGYGGSGVVIVRFPDSANLAVSPGCNSTAPAPCSTKVATFTVSGTLTVTP